MAHADVRLAPLPEGTAFVVNGLPFGEKAFSALTSGIRQHSPEASDSKILKGVVENRLLAEAYAQGQHPSQSAAMSKMLEKMFPHSHLTQKDRLWQEYAMLIDNVFPLPVSDALKKRCIALENISAEALMAMLGAEAGNTKKIVDPTVTPGKKREASEVVLGKVHCEESVDRQVALDQVLESADEASALQLWRGEVATLNILLSKLSDLKLREGMLLQQKTLTTLDLQTLWQTVGDKQTRVDFESEAGVSFDLHHSPETIQRLKSAVTEREIDQYYDQHASDYQQVSKVNARHITVATQTVADQVVAEIRGGLDFGEAVKKYSLAGDRVAKNPGALTEIDRRDKTLPFMKKLALILPAGEVSNPFRMPDGKSYEIYWVDAREAEYLPKSDESVRSDIRREIAGQKAKVVFSDTLSKVWKNAEVVLDAGYFNKPWTEKWPE